jgi:hypothetical protein
MINAMQTTFMEFPLDAASQVTQAAPGPMLTKRPSPEAGALKLT